MGRAGHGLSLEEEGRALVERLGGRWTPRGGMCRCPAHDDRTPSLSVRPGRTRLLLHCFAGCAASDILRELHAGGLARRIARDPNEVFFGRDHSRSAAQRIWDAARSIAGTPAEAYLAARGLASSSPSLRFLERTPFGSGASAIFRPALIAAVRDNSGLTGIHRTYLEPGCDGVPIAGLKRGLGAFGAGAVRLGSPGQRLGLSEGIETALSAAAIFGVPCWATLGADRFSRIDPPDSVRELLLFLDRDGGGRRAEALARQAFSKFAAIDAFYPPKSGEDWNDVLRSDSLR